MNANQAVIEVDVREDLKNGLEPFGKIMQAVGRLEPEENLRLLAPFEPIPLYTVMSRLGFDHQVKQEGPQSLKGQTLSQRCGMHSGGYSPQGDGPLVWEIKGQTLFQCSQARPPHLRRIHSGRVEVGTRLSILRAALQTGLVIKRT